MAKHEKRPRNLFQQVRLFQQEWGIDAGWLWAVSSSTAPRDVQSERRLVVPKELLTLPKDIAASVYKISPLIGRRRSEFYELPYWRYVQKKPPITTPTVVVQARFRTVLARKRCAANWESKSLPKSTKSHLLHILLAQYTIAFLPRASRMSSLRSYSQFPVFSMNFSVCRHLLELWIGYAAGKTVLITTAITTDVAFQLDTRT
jgi:hypothetical protein